jgi:uncharacterized membrane protein YuzA (DUF378 family)
MPLGTFVVLVLILLLPPSSIAGVAVSARRFGRNAAAPRFAVRVAYALAGLAGLAVAAGLVLGVVSFAATADGKSAVVSDRARHLGEGISEVMNCSALGLVLAGLCAVWVSFWKARVRKRPPTF